MKKNLDELLKDKNLLFDYKKNKDTSMIRPCIIEADSLSKCVDVEIKADSLLTKITDFDNKIHRIVGDGSIAGRMISAIARKITKKEETSLIEDYNKLISDTMEIHDSLGSLFFTYKEGFKKVRTLFEKKSFELMNYVGSMKCLMQERENNDYIRTGLEEKLAGIEPEKFPSYDEVKYSDALTNLKLRTSAINSAIKMVNGKIERSADQKKRLFEEEQYHNGVLDAYVEAYSICEDILEFFSATVPLHISSTYLIRNARGLIETTESLYQLSRMLHAKTQEGLNFVSNFNKKNPFYSDDGNAQDDVKVYFNMGSYINGRLEE